MTNLTPKQLGQTRVFFVEPESSVRLTGWQADFTFLLFLKIKAKRWHKTLTSYLIYQTLFKVKGILNHEKVFITTYLVLTCQYLSYIGHNKRWKACPRRALARFYLKIWVFSGKKFRCYWFNFVRVWIVSGNILPTSKSRPRSLDSTFSWFKPWQNFKYDFDEYSSALEIETTNWPMFESSTSSITQKASSWPRRSSFTIQPITDFQTP